MSADDDEVPVTGSRRASIEAYFAAADRAREETTPLNAEYARAQRAAARAHWDRVFAEPWVRDYLDRETK